MADFPYTGAWDNSLTFDAVQATTLQYGKGTVTTRIKTSINPVNQSWSVGFNVYGDDIYQEINSFLTARKGVLSFTFRFSGTVYPTKFRCEVWDWTHYPNQVYGFKGIFIETRQVQIAL